MAAASSAITAKRAATATAGRAAANSLDATILLPRAAKILRVRPPEPHCDPALYSRLSLASVVRSTQDTCFRTTTTSGSRGTSFFELHDGPPYANGPLHVGHALNKLIKDFALRFEFLRGERQVLLFQPGFDCHGLPIELAATKAKPLATTAKPRDDENALSVRARARAHAERNFRAQAAMAQSWGLLGDWSQPYLTMDNKYVGNQLHVLARLVDAKLVFRGLMPVYYSPSSRTALAESEIEYRSRTSRAAFVALRLRCSPEHLLVWTSTPWTLPANRAVAVDPNAEYILIKDSANHDSSSWWIAKDAFESFSQYFPTATFCHREGNFVLCRGDNLVGKEYLHPFDPKVQCKVLPSGNGLHVVASEGTGLVHVAPGHGAEDYELGKAHNIQVYCPVDDLGCYDNTVSPHFLRGVSVLEQGNKLVLELLAKAGTLIKQHDYVHDYPHDWRTGGPLLMRATPQWLVDVSEIRPAARKALEYVDIMPPQRRNEMLHMLDSRNHWCISRQRSWGVPIPALTFSDCKDEMMTTAFTSGEIIDHAAKVFESHGGPDAWWKLPVSSFLPSNLKSQMQQKQVSLGRDTMDVWFDSGCSWARNSVDAESTDLCVEGSDQLRGWFQSSLLTRVAYHIAKSKLNIAETVDLKKASPYKRLLVHGFVVDETGQKMSKSKGNAILPEQLCSSKYTKVGIEGMRTWAALCNFDDQTVKIGENVMHASNEVYQHIRSAIRFALTNASNFKEARSIDAYGEIENYVLYQLALLNKKVLEAYKIHSYTAAVRSVEFFCTTIASPILFEYAKDSLYCDAEDDASRKALRACLSHVARQCVQMVAPVAPLLAEEAWSVAPHVFTFTNAVTKGYFETRVLQRQKWEHAQQAWLQSVFANSDWNEAFLMTLALRRKCYEMLSKMREKGMIKSFLDTCVSVKPIESKKHLDVLSLLSKFSPAQQANLFGVSHFDVQKCGTDMVELPNSLTETWNGKVIITVAPLSGVWPRCPRCRKHHQGKKGCSENILICGRCALALSKNSKVVPNLN